MRNAARSPLSTPIPRSTTAASTSTADSATASINAARVPRSKYWGLHSEGFLTMGKSMRPWNSEFADSFATPSDSEPILDPLDTEIYHGKAHF
jgi:hypothetical protein